MVDANKSIEKIIKKHNLTPTELERILLSVQNSAPRDRVSFKDYFSKHERIGIISDTHIGHQMFDEPFFKHMAKTMESQGVERIYHAGDLLEGMSGRPGHIYELSHIGFENQQKYCADLFNEHLSKFKIFGINGNHDEWYLKKNNGGVNVSADLAHRVKNYTHLGSNEARIELRKGVDMMLFHPNDGTAYATSYKLQKLIESFTGGDKPSIVVEGHYHKAMYMFCRNVHAVEAGTIMGQSEWMRGKKIPAHKGFWIFDIEMGRGGIGKFSPEFYPGYK